MLLMQSSTDTRSFVAWIPLDFIARLVATIPPPRFHMTRFHGVLAPHCALRPLVVPVQEPLAEPPLQLPLFALPRSSSSPHAAAARESNDELSMKAEHDGRIQKRNLILVFLELVSGQGLDGILATDPFGDSAGAG